MSVQAALYAAALSAATVYTQDLPRPDLTRYPEYDVQYTVTGIFRIFGSNLKGAIYTLAAGFAEYQPSASIGIYNYTISEGSIAGLYTGLSEIAPAANGYLPTEISIATGGHKKQGTLWPAVIVVHKDNSLTKLTMNQLDRIFSSERIAGWKIGENNLASAVEGDNMLFTSEYARDASTNVRKWSDLGIKGKWAHKEIQTYGYIAPGFITYMERKLFHWSQKWNPNYRDRLEQAHARGALQGTFGIGWAAPMHVRKYLNVKTVAIAQDESGPHYQSNATSISDRVYPLKRDAYVYVNRQPGKPMEAKTREFLRFVLSKRGQEIIADLDKYYALTLDELDSHVSCLE